MKSLITFNLFFGIAHFAGTLLAQPNTNLPVSASSSATNLATKPDYVLVVDDTVFVRVYREDDLSASVRISNSGDVTLSLLGAVQIAGKTRAEAAKRIRDLYEEKYLVEPQVTVEVTKYAARRFTVLGQVARPGTFEWSADERLMILQAISLAGGASRLGNLGRVTVQRGEGKDRTVFKVDAEAIGKDKNKEDFEVQPNDIITVGEKIF